ncbi:MAG: guanylate kinase [Clostridiales bacterium]|nr:guanylate kinase [Clostridiales bacterium]MCF8022723.1 guanylate kinase [Clostridiales bacterium]
MNKKGKLIVISGPSGSGKGAVRKVLKSYRSDFVFSVSATTRCPRAGEVDGKDYYFIDNEHFEQMIKDNRLLEWARVYDYYYGTPQQPVKSALDKGFNVILEIDVQGALQLKDRFPQAVLVFILPPTPEDLYKRLYKRNADPAEEIKMRLNWAKKEVKLIDRYNYIIINDQVEIAARKLNSIIEAESCRPGKHNLNSDWYE